ncbi:MAG: HD domain-containing protein, partial [Bacteroidaceae bacterium]|nr:HD domain-containing protein [Bacteroidaceae bacterium]
MKELTQAEVAKLLNPPLFHLIGQAADELHMECYLVGGFVRDLYMGNPSDDIDVMVVGDALELAKAFIRLTKKRLKPSVYATSGAVLVKCFDKEIEFNTARSESYVKGSDAPQTVGTLDEDLHRRDFTVNALALCLNQDRFGELIDLFDGLWDIRDRVIDTPLHPDDTFEDDPLRMLRAIRFATRLYFTIHQDVFDSIQRNREKILTVAPERLSEEINKIMLSDTPSVGFELLFSTGLLQLILPELQALQGVEKMNGRGHKDNFFHTLEVLDNMAKATKDWEDDEKRLWIRWATLLHDIGKPKSKRWEPSVGWTFHNHNAIGDKMVPVLFKRLKMPLN